MGLMSVQVEHGSQFFLLIVDTEFLLKRLSFLWCLFWHICQILSGLAV